VRHDARHLADLGGTFDTVLDCGLFHLFTEADRAAYVDGLRRALRTGGRYFMLGFSRSEPGDWPHKLSREEITAAFTGGWRIDCIEPATIETRIESTAVQAWLVALTRI
jgi:cyclopropane fatty-acyl-phospholipid synthase-like methyltransferase